MKPPLSAPHGTSLGTTAGITAVIAMVAAVSLLGQCSNLDGTASWLAAGAGVAFLLASGGLYTARDYLGEALDLAVGNPHEAGVAAARGIARFHLGMSAVFLGGGLAAEFRLALPIGGLALAAPLVGLVLATVALRRWYVWSIEARRRAGAGEVSAAEATA